MRAGPCRLLLTLCGETVKPIHEGDDPFLKEGHALVIALAVVALFLELLRDARQGFVHELHLGCPQVQVFLFLRGHAQGEYSTGEARKMRKGGVTLFWFPSVLFALTTLSAAACGECTGVRVEGTRTQGEGGGIGTRKALCPLVGLLSPPPGWDGDAAYSGLRIWAHNLSEHRLPRKGRGGEIQEVTPVTEVAVAPKGGRLRTQKQQQK